MGNTAKQCMLGLFQDSDFAGDLEDSNIYFKWNVVRFWKSYICSDMWDVQETNFSFAQFNRIRHHLYGCRIEVGRYSRTWFLGSNRRSSWKRLREIKHGWTRLWINVKFVRHLTQFKNENNLKEWSMIWTMLIFIPSNVNSSHQEALLYVFGDNEPVIKMIIKGKKPDNETCFQDSQSCSWLVVRSNQCGPHDPN